MNPPPKTLEQVTEYLKTIPPFEVKVVRADGHYPIYVETTLQRVLGVVRMGAREVLDPETVIGETSIEWRASEDPSRPGIVIDAMGGVPTSVSTNVNEAEVMLLLVGERV